MNDIHPIGAFLPSGKSLESVDPRFVRQGLLDARDKTWNAFHQVQFRLKTGMTESEARRTALQTLLELGSTKHWHQPYVRLGPGTALTFHDPLQPTYRLQDGDPVYMDLGPVWSDSESGLEYEGDVGDTFVIGANPEAERCATSA